MTFITMTSKRPLLVPRRKLQSFLIYGQTFSSYNRFATSKPSDTKMEGPGARKLYFPLDNVKNRKCTEGPQTDLKRLTVETTMFMLNTCIYNYQMCIVYTE